MLSLTSEKSAIYRELQTCVLYDFRHVNKVLFWDCLFGTSKPPLFARLLFFDAVLQDFNCTWKVHSGAMLWSIYNWGAHTHASMCSNLEIGIHPRSRNLLRHGLSSNSFSTPALNSNYLIWERSQAHSQARPSIEMVRNRDSSTSSLRRSNRDVLIERRGSQNWWLIRTSVFVDRVGWSIARYSALVCSECRRVQAVLDDVVFDERTCRPAVHAEKSCAATCAESTAEGNWTDTMLVTYTAR